jgi:hypothetical protein
LAGFAVVLVLLLFLLKQYKKRHGISGGQLRSVDSESLPPGTSHSAAPMANNPTGPSGVAVSPFFKRMRPTSTATASTGPSERGFQKISGRKLESVLVSGGDGYGDPNTNLRGNMSETSFYRDSGGTWGGPSSHHSSMVVGPASHNSQLSSSMLVSGSPRKSAAPSEWTFTSAGGQTANPGKSEHEVVTMRPGPARVPVTQPAFTISPNPGGPIRPPTSERAITGSPVFNLRQPDPLGRSRRSQDGSRGSKFAEDLG